MSPVKKIRLYRDRIRLNVGAWAVYLYFYFKYKNPAKPGKEVFISIECIKLMINDRELSRVDRRYKRIYKSVNSIIGGDFWNHVNLINNNNLKFVGFQERFHGGRSWRETSLFAEYEEKMAKEGKVQGCRNMEDLVRRYEQEHDALFDSLKEEGVKSSRQDIRITPIYVYIHKDGRFVFTSGGNHRLNMAKVIGVNSIPVQIKGRHIQWQAFREELYELGYEGFFEKYPALAGHPDLMS